MLVVDDEAVMRNFCARVLRADSHEVLVAACAGEAVATLATQGADIDVVVTDIMMPGLGWRELVRHLEVVHPRIHVVLMSGYSPWDLMELGMCVADFPFLHKPFTIEDLSRTVRELPPEGALG